MDKVVIIARFCKVVQLHKPC